MRVMYMCDVLPKYLHTARLVFLSNHNLDRDTKTCRTDCSGCKEREYFFKDKEIDATYVVIPTQYSSGQSGILLINNQQVEMVGTSLLAALSQDPDLLSCIKDNNVSRTLEIAKRFASTKLINLFITNV